MIRRSILIIDKDPKNLKVLENNLIEAYYEVDLASNDKEALHKLNTKHYDALLSELAGPGIDGYSLLENIQKSSINTNIPVVFLTQKNDIWTKIKSIKMGAKDYIVKPIHVKEIIARINMLLSRIERKIEEEDIIKKKFTGKLEDISLFDLIKVMGVEKKTGVLSLYKNNGFTGQIFFENGNIINAGTLALKGEDAVYKMMTWQKGLFSMHFCDIDVIDEIKVSNLAILLQGAMRMELRDKILKQLPSLDSIVTTTQNFKKITSKQDLAGDLFYFLDLFDGYRNLGEIINASKEDEQTTLKRILQLYQLGFLNIIQDQPKKQAVNNQNLNSKTGIGEITTTSLIDDLINETNPEKLTSKISTRFNAPQSTRMANQVPVTAPKANKVQTKTTQAMQTQPGMERPVLTKSTMETPILERKPKIQQEPVTMASSSPATMPEFANTPKAKGNVLILGTDKSPRKLMVQNLTLGQPIESRVKAANVSEIFFGIAQFKGGNSLNITTFSMEKEFTPLLEYFAPKTLGYILLIDIRDANWSYYRYLLNVLRGKLSVPSVIVVSNKSTNDPGIDEIRSILSLKQNEKLVFSSEFDTENSKKIIYALFKNYYK